MSLEAIRSDYWHKWQFQEFAPILLPSKMYIHLLRSPVNWKKGIASERTVEFSLWNLWGVFSDPIVFIRFLAEDNWKKFTSTKLLSLSNFLSSSFKNWICLSFACAVQQQDPEHFCLLWIPRWFSWTFSRNYSSGKFPSNSSPPTLCLNELPNFRGSCEVYQQIRHLSKDFWRKEIR